MIATNKSGEELRALERWLDSRKYGTANISAQERNSALPERV
jgi:hypothetical protein